MIRQGHTLEVETPFGTFYGGFYDTAAKHGPEFYAETESGTVTVNGVTYSGTVYGRRYGYGGELFLSCLHLTRWDGRHFQPASTSACKKLAAVLLPAMAALAADADAVKAAKVRALRGALGHAVYAVNREIETANKLAAQLRELGEDVSDLAKVDES